MDVRGRGKSKAGKSVFRTNVFLSIGSDWLRPVGGYGHMAVTQNGSDQEIEGHSETLC